jgi:hypothetical protein
MSSSYTLDKAELLGGLGETTLYGMSPEIGPIAVR